MAYVVDDSGEKSAKAAVSVADLNRIALIQDKFPSQASIGFYRRRGKRMLDLAVGSIMLFAAAPILLLLLLAASLDGANPIFAQTRIGRFGRPFKCYKIRSMRPDAEDQLAAILAADPVAAAEWAVGCKLTNDPRITRVGGFLRKSSLDELPQLWNVVRGDMSLVGPRPVIIEEIPRYGPEVAVYMQMKPGLTGLWQVDGRNDVSYEGRVRLDVDYAATHDFGRDLSILLRTGLSVMKLTGK